MRRYWRWDGDRWVPRVKAVGRLKNLPRWLIWSLALWIPLLVAWIPAVMVVASHHDSRALVTSVAAWTGGTAVVATIAFGASLGFRRRWGYLAWSFLLGMATAGLVIFFAFDGSQPVNAPDDPGLGIGAMLVTVALAPVVAIVLGGGLGRLARRLRN